MINLLNSFAYFIFAVNIIFQPHNILEANPVNFEPGPLYFTIFKSNHENPEPPDDVQQLIHANSFFNIWYGLTQSFGQFGQPQPWVNVLGELENTSGIESLSYTLNGSSQVALNFLKDKRRLNNDGDFNIDLLSSDLINGQNTVVVTAQKDDGSAEIETILVNYNRATGWPLPYTIDWNTVSNDAEIQDVAQVVDGKWTITPDGIRTVEPGYDRLIAIGDRTWDNYEVTVPITIHSVSSTDYGVGVLVRWDGHTDDPVICSQPKCGWLPLGNIGWISSLYLRLFYGGEKYFVWQPDYTYMLKMRVETTGLNSTYQVKIWNPSNQIEPDDWGITRTRTNSPANGSFLLLAHLADVTFGNLTVIPVGDLTQSTYLPFIFR